MFSTKVDLGDPPTGLGISDWEAKFTLYPERAGVGATVDVGLDSPDADPDRMVRVTLYWAEDVEQDDDVVGIWNRRLRELTHEYPVPAKYEALGKRTLEYLEEVRQTDPEQADRWVTQALERILEMFGIPGVDQHAGVADYRDGYTTWLTVLSYESGTSERALADKLWNHGAYLGSAEQLQAVVRATLGAA